MAGTTVPAGRHSAINPTTGYRVASALSQRLPAPFARATAEAAAVLLSPILRDRRDMVRRHQQRVHGRPMSRWALGRQVRRTFASYGRYWAESLRLPAVDAVELDRLMSYEGLGYLDAALAGGKGAIMAIPHLGGWDPAGAWFTRRGYELTVVVEPLEPPELFEWFVGLRREFGISVIPLGPGAGTGVLKALRANHMVCLLCDRDIGGGGVEVEFFGERTTLPAGPATLALRARSPLLPTAVFFDGRGHHAVVEPPVDVERTGHVRDDVTRLTQAMAYALEDLIRRAPEQWHLFQPNWPSDRPGDRTSA